MAKKQNIKETIAELKELFEGHHHQFHMFLNQEKHTNTEEVIIFMMADLITAITMIGQMDKTMKALSRFLDSIPED